MHVLQYIATTTGAHYYYCYYYYYSCGNKYQCACARVSADITGHSLSLRGISLEVALCALSSSLTYSTMAQLCSRISSARL
jgi:hypothetical protein